jgi:hypothetical protein
MARKICPKPGFVKGIQGTEGGIYNCSLSGAHGRSLSSRAALGKQSLISGSKPGIALVVVLDHSLGSVDPKQPDSSLTL